MNDTQAKQSPTTTNGDAVKTREAYTPPQLRVYGSIAQLTMGTTGTGADGVMMTMVGQMSDRSAKENIIRVGTHPLGIGLYLFDYKAEVRATAGFGRRLGVMADEVEQVLPEAVAVHADGYKRVNYALLAQATAAIH